MFCIIVQVLPKRISMSAAMQKWGELVAQADSIEKSMANTEDPEIAQVERYPYAIRELY